MNRCPAADELARYVRGELDETAAGSIDQHLDGCPRCDAAAATLEQQAALGKQWLAPTIGSESTQHSDQPWDFFQDLPVPERPPIDYEEREGPGSEIGPYQLIEQLGEGGFGIVYLAEQQQPLRRQVALKVIKPGMDTRQVIARFDAERQALAVMEHPNIARVFDAGQTRSSRPYFVMELVRGMPITEYCDRAQLPLRERLELFLDVCAAVQHAHLKGIIHRDLKPSNILVTTQDEKRIVKVIDFGIAKAILQPLTEHTLFTTEGQFIGTPLYMSPEQAAADSLDVDMRSDVYSLGVVLFELLTGTTPLDRHRLKQAGFDGVRKLLSESETPRPSSRIEGRGRISTAAANRRTDPRALRQMLGRELDWIVLQALEKDRSRRYQSVRGLSLDIQRYLQNEPVGACRPTLRYRVSKFIQRRQRTLLAIAGVSLIALVIACAGGIQGISARWSESQRVALEKYKTASLLRENKLLDEFAAVTVREWLAKPDGLTPEQTDYIVKKLVPTYTKLSQEDSIQMTTTVKLAEELNHASAKALERGELNRAVEYNEAAYTLVRNLQTRNMLSRDYRLNLAVALARRAQLLQLYDGPEKLAEAIETAPRWIKRAHSWDQALDLEQALTDAGGFGFDALQPILNDIPPDKVASLEEVLAVKMWDAQLDIHGPKPNDFGAASSLRRATYLQNRLLKLSPNEPRFLRMRAQIELERWNWLKLARSRLGSGELPQQLTLFDEELQSESDLSALKPDEIIEIAAEEAERALQRALQECQNQEPELWTTFQVTSQRGGFLADRKEFATAEPLLLAGYEGLEQRSSQIPWLHQKEKKLAAVRLVRLYEAWNRPDDADRWREVSERSPERPTK